MTRWQTRSSKENAEAVWKAKDVEFDVARIDEIEAVTKHDVIAFTHLAEIIGNDEARFVHQGTASSDVLDTTFNIQLTRAADILIADLEGLLAALKRWSTRIPCASAGRTASMRNPPPWADLPVLRGNGP